MPWYRLQPDLYGQLIVEGQSSFGDDLWIASAVTDDRSLAVLYVPRAMLPLSRRERLKALLRGDFGPAWSGVRQRSLQVDLAMLKGELKAEWFFPATGETEQIDEGRSLAGTPRRTFDVPCRTNPQECDAVLILRGQP
jgi:hypothetical protein